MAHQAHGSQAKAPSAPNQSVAPQQMIQPLRAVDERDHQSERRGEISSSREQVTAHAQERRDASWKARRPAAERRAEISRSERPRHSRKRKTSRIEIRRRDCCRPTSTDSATADGLRTSSARRRRRRAGSKSRNRHSRKEADRARAAGSKRATTIAPAASAPRKFERVERVTQ